MNLPPLYGKDRKGNTLIWQVSAKGDCTVTEYGRLGGKLIRSIDRVRSTNVGRANQREGESQAQAEAKSAWDKKRKLGYFETIEAADTTTVYLPMLAQPLSHEVKTASGYQVVKHTVPDTFTVQRKLNGLRCLSFNAPAGSALAVNLGADGIVMRSREGEDWDTLGHIANELKRFSHSEEIMDGEIYQHGVPLQTLNSYVKRWQMETAYLQYHIYDLPSEQHTWAERKAKLREKYIEYVYRSWDARFPDLAPPGEFLSWTDDIDQNPLPPFVAQLPIQYVRSYTVNTEDAARNLEQLFVSEGYEGAILRREDRPYEFGLVRPDSMLKLKSFQDADFEILDVKGREIIDETGSYWIVDKFVFRNNRGNNSFESVPRGSMLLRRQWWDERETLRGRFGVVRFLERSNDGIPQGNPVMIAIRLEEDLSESEPGLWE